MNRTNQLERGTGFPETPAKDAGVGHKPMVGTSCRNEYSVSGECSHS
jgi:hypothetical protein